MAVTKNRDVWLSRSTLDLSNNSENNFQMWKTFQDRNWIQACKMITHHSENFNFQTNVGPILISVNPYTDVGNSLTLNSTREAAKNSEALLKVAERPLFLVFSADIILWLLVCADFQNSLTITWSRLLKKQFAFRETPATHRSVLFNEDSESEWVGEWVSERVTDNAM